jgi:hypothetical protein
MPRYFFDIEAAGLDCRNQQEADRKGRANV